MPSPKRIHKTKKKPVKKSTRKRAEVKRGAKNKMVTAAPECCFWVHEGPVVANLKELVRALERDISDAQYKHHISQGKSDFSSWIEDVLCDSACAEKLSRVKTRKTAIAKLKTCISAYR